MLTHKQNEGDEMRTTCGVQDLSFVPVFLPSVLECWMEMKGIGFIGLLVYYLVIKLFNDTWSDYSFCSELRNK